MVDVNDDFGIRLLRAWEDVQETANRATPYCEATSSCGNNSKLMESALRRSYSPSGEPQQQAIPPLRHASGEQQQGHEEPLPLQLPPDALLLPSRRAMNLSAKLLGTGAKINGRSSRSLPTAAEASSLSSMSTSSSSSNSPFQSAKAFRCLHYHCRLLQPCGRTLWPSALAAAVWRLAAAPTPPQVPAAMQHGCLSCSSIRVISRGELRSRRSVPA